jgi:Flp pilus assembly protein TadD
VEGRADDELVARVLSSWFRAAHGDVGSAEGAAIRIGGTPALAFQHAMRLDLAGRNAEALSAYAEAERSGAREPTGIEAYADLLARTGARQDAAALLARYAGSAAVDAAAARLAAQGRAAEQPLTAARGAAIGLVELAGVFRRGHDLDAALATLAMAQSLAPELDYVRLVFAQAQRDIGNLSAARALLSEIGANSAYAAPARATEMWMLADAGRNEEALALARANAESGDARALRNLADLYGAMDRYGEAAPIYAQLIEEASQDWSLYFARGVAYERVGNWEQAERDLRVALELAPNQPEVLNYLGYAWADRGERLDEARAMIERAVQMLPASGAVVDSLGWVHYRQGDYQRAADLLERAVQLSPVNPTLNDHLGDAYWRLGRRTEARNQWRRALGLDPEHPDPIRVKLERGLPEDAGLRP